jgi:hypothetical protein
MNTDVFLSIGKTHAICQDYADRAKDFIVVSDGCSTAPESNVGSLLLTRAAKNFLDKFPFQDGKQLCSHAIDRAQIYAHALELNEDSLLATLLVAKRTERYYQVVLSGDGVVAARYAGTNRWKVTEVSCNSGAPYYLRYTLNDAVEKNYLTKFNLPMTLRYFEIDLPHLEVTVTESREFKLTSEPSLWAYGLEQYDAVAIFSDGVSSFVKTAPGEQTSNVPLEEVLAEVLHFKNYAGEFVQRRCKAAFKKFAENHWSNSDDFSMAVICG